MRAPVAEVPFVILHNACIGNEGIGIQGGDAAQAYQAVVIEVHSRFGGDHHVLVHRISASAGIQGDEGHHELPGLCIVVYGVGERGGVQQARSRVAEVPGMLGECAASVQAGHIRELRALALAGVGIAKSSYRRG